MPTIIVDIDKSQWVIMNPYGLKYNTKAAIGGLDEEEPAPEIVSGEVNIRSLSNCPLELSVTSAKASVPSGVTLASSSLAKSKATNKQVFLYMEFKGESGWLDRYKSSNKNQLVLTTAGSSKEKMAVIPAYTGEAKTMEEALAIGEDEFQKATFMIAGDLTTYSEKAWAAKDAPTINLVFNLRPLTNT